MNGDGMPNPIVNFLSKVTQSDGKRFNLTNPSDWKFVFQSNQTGSGVSVTEESSLKFIAVYACVNLISSTIASTERNIYELTNSGMELATNHDQWRLTKLSPLDGYTPFSWMKEFCMNGLLWGTAYARILRNDNNRPTGFQIWPSKYVEKRDLDEELRLYEYINHETGETVNERDIIKVKFSADGQSPIAHARETIGAGVSMSKFMGMMFGKNKPLDGAIKVPGSLTEEQLGRFRESWAANYGRNVAFLEHGMEYQNIGMPLSDAQFIEGYSMNIEDIARIFNVQPHKIGHLAKSSFNNIHQQNLEYYEDTIFPHLVGIEQEFNIKTFRPSEVGRFVQRFEMRDRIIRSNVAEMRELFRSGVNNAYMTPNEARKFLGLDPRPEGDRTFIQVNMMPVDRADEIIDRNESSDTGASSGSE